LRRNGDDPWPHDDYNGTHVTVEGQGDDTARDVAGDHTNTTIAEQLREV
jgi:hypothetical protein